MISDCENTVYIYSSQNGEIQCETLQLTHAATGGAIKCVVHLRDGLQADVYGWRDNLYSLEPSMCSFVTFCFIKLTPF